MRWENGRSHGESQLQAILGLFQLPEMPTHHLAKGMNTPRSSSTWLNRTVLGIGLASMFSDWSHEIATTVMPAFLATMGVAAFWVGLIEGVSDGLSSFAKMASGYYTDKLPVGT